MNINEWCATSTYVHQIDRQQNSPRLRFGLSLPKVSIWSKTWLANQLQWSCDIVCGPRVSQEFSRLCPSCPCQILQQKWRPSLGDVDGLDGSNGRDQLVLSKATWGPKCCSSGRPVRHHPTDRFRNNDSMYDPMNALQKVHVEYITQSNTHTHGIDTQIPWYVSELAPHRAGTAPWPQAASP